MWCSDGEREWEDLELPVLWRLLSGISPWRLWEQKKRQVICTCKLCAYQLCVTYGPKSLWYYVKLTFTFFMSLVLLTLNFMLKCASTFKRTHTASLAPAYLSKAAVLLPKSWQTAQWGDRGVTLAATNFSGGLTVDVIMVPIQVVVTRRAEQGTWRGKGARHRTSTVSVGGGLPKRHWEEKETHRGLDYLSPYRMKLLKTCFRVRVTINRMHWWGNNCSATHSKATKICLKLVTRWH